MYTLEERLHLIEAWKTSGLSQSEFSEQNGFTRSTLANWIYNLKKKETKKNSLKSNKPASNFIKVTPDVINTPNYIDVIYPNGVTIKAAGTDLKLISDLIKLY